MAHSETMQRLRSAIREVYAWPGGYEMFVILDDGETLCMKCARENYRSISASTRLNDRNGDGWGLAAIDAECNTDSDVSCCHCNRVICWDWRVDYYTENGRYIPTVNSERIGTATFDTEHDAMQYGTAYLWQGKD